jgi:PEP-CTERM motif
MITIASLKVGTSLSDINGNAIPFTAMSGSISTAAIPEPSTLILASSAVLIGRGAGWRRRS